MNWNELELAPAYPSPATLEQQLASKVLSIDQRRSLVAHTLSRACLFADLPLLSFLFRHPTAGALVDLSSKDEDGLCIVSQSIQGFGDNSDSNLDREECIRLLVAQGASFEEPDALGWTPLHHAALRAPATLIAYLIARGASCVAQTYKTLTPLDIISAYQPVPNREDVVLILREAMHEVGWHGSRLEQRRSRRQQLCEARQAKNAKSAAEWSQMGEMLGIEDAWWGESSSAGSSETEDDREENDFESPDDIFTEDMLSPQPDFASSMIVFSLSAVPEVLQRIITEARPAPYPIVDRSAPANIVYLMARFACLHCDEVWVDTLLTSALDCIEANTYAREDRKEDMSQSTFWLYNTTLLLHLLRCDSPLNEMCESLDLLYILEELIKSIYAFIVRGAEKRIQPLIQPALLDHSPLSLEFESIQFESDQWSFFRSLTTPKRKPGPAASNSISGFNDQSSTSGHSSAVNGSLSGRSTPTPAPTSPSPGIRALSSLRQTIGGSNAQPISPLPLISQNSSLLGTTSVNENMSRSSVGPTSITAILSSLHNLLRLYSINPVIIIQAMAQVFYWIACETFNKMILQKKYLCRSRAVQIGVNVQGLESWVGSSGFPSNVALHFQPLKELLMWLQCHSSIDQFTSLIDTIQTMQSLNPCQMRRAVRDYRYEVSESRMGDEFVQYLAQMQKDWERRRIRKGVEARQRECAEKNRDRGESVMSGAKADIESLGDRSISPELNESEPNRELSDKAIEDAQQAIDRLFERDRLKSEWMPPRAPDALGELLDSAFPLPLIFPSNPELMAAWPGPGVEQILEQEEREKRMRTTDLASIIFSNGSGRVAKFEASNLPSRSPSRASVGNRGAMEWRLRAQTVRSISPRVMEALAGTMGTYRPSRRVQFDAEGKVNAADDEDVLIVGASDLVDEMEPEAAPSHFTKRPYRVSRLPRESSGEDIVIPEQGLSVTPERRRLPSPVNDALS